MKNKGCSLSGRLMLKAKSSAKFSKSKNLRNFDLLGALEIRGYEKLRFLQQKAHPCMSARRLSHFAPKSVGGSDLHGWARKKVKKFRTPIGMMCRRQHRDCATAQPVIRLKQESPADAVKPARRKSIQKLLQFDVFRFISPNSISPNFKLPMHSVAR